MTNDRYVCINCEEAGRACVVELNTAGKCPVCNSESVLSESVLKAFAALPDKLKSTNVSDVVREKSSLDWSNKRSEVMKQNLLDVAKPVRAFLLRNKLHDLNTWWQGQRYWLEWSFYDEKHATGEYEYVDFVLGNATEEKRLRLYFNVEDDGMHEVLDAVATSAASNKKTTS